MFKVDKAITRYVHAFLSYVIQNDLLQPVCKDVTFLQNQFRAVPTLAYLFRNPTLSASEKHQLVALLCQPGVHPVLKKFLNIIVMQHQVGQLRAILDAFESAYDAYRGIESALLTTAVALPEDLIEKLIEKVKKWVPCKEIRLTKQIDPSIIGGYRLQIGSLKLDKTIQHYLCSLQKQVYTRQSNT